jgi:hypothetical protein
MDLDVLLKYLEAGQYATTFAGILTAIWLYYREQRRARARSEDEAFDQLDAAYVQFMQLCMANPDLDIHESPRNDAVDTSASMELAEQAAFAILISLFERVFLAFAHQHAEFRQRQWGGWVMFMKSYVYRDNFKKNWIRIGRQFDVKFQRFIGELMGDAAAPDMGAAARG